MALLHDADYDGTILQRNMANADYLYRYPRMQSMAQVRVKPYRDEYMDLTSDPYAGDRSSDEDDSHVSGDSVRAYVNRLLFNAALKMTGEHVHNQGAGEDTKKCNYYFFFSSISAFVVCCRFLWGFLCFLFVCCFFVVVFFG